jgi:cytochrome c peroxidase
LNQKLQSHSMQIADVMEVSNIFVRQRARILYCVGAKFVSLIKVKSSGLLAVALTGFAAVAAQDPSDKPALPWGGDPPAAPAYARAASITALGRQLFFDRSLSASGTMSCATCHDSANHFEPPNALPVQMGGPKLDKPGTRATPGLTYVASTPFFTEHYYESEDEGDESVDQGPVGGRTWDGRVNRARDQAAIPLLAPNEMANKSEAAVVAHAAAAPYAAQIRRIYGDTIFDNTRRAFVAIGEALEAYQQTPEKFSPFTSKYDAFLRRQTEFTPQEARGLKAFNDPARGNCAHCHKSQLSPVGRLPMFTDSGFVAVGVLRNNDIPANADPKYFDLGACGPDRKDLANRPEFCGLFKAPTLRNVASRKSFYHNGVFHSLEDAVAFYATRDTNPERWYPVGRDGKVRKFDDMPVEYQRNINFEPPFGRHPGEAPAMSAQDVSDIVAFLRTLTDGFKPAQQAGTAAISKDTVLRRDAPHAGAAATSRQPAGDKPGGA